MKNLLGLIVVLLTLIGVGCAKRDSDGSLLLRERVSGDNPADNPYVEVIDSCEYIIWGYYRMAHKGNCRFCASRCDIIPGPPIVDGENYGKDKEY